MDFFSFSFVTISMLMIFIYFIFYYLIDWLYYFYYYYYLRNLFIKYLVYDVIIDKVNYAILNVDYSLNEDYQFIYFNHNLIDMLVFIFIGWVMG
jgi:hypothetical protein